MELIGTVGRIEVRVDERAVVVSWPAGETGGMGLVNLLAGGGDVQLSGTGGAGSWMTARVGHTDAVDRRVAELVEVLRELKARMGWVQLGMDNMLVGSCEAKETYNQC